MCICWCVTEINYKMHGATVKIISWGNLKVYTAWRRPSHRWENNIKKNLK